MSPAGIDRVAVERVADLLLKAEKPVTFRQLKLSARLEDRALEDALEAARLEGKGFRWPDYKRRQYFWSQSAEEAAERAVLETASTSALSRTKLIDRARKMVPGFAPTAMQQIIANLLSGRQLQQVPAFTSGKLLIRSGELAAYAASARAFIEQKFRKAGFDPSMFLSSIPAAANPPAVETSGNVAALLLDAVRSLQPSEGAPVTAQRLRQRLPAVSKSEFDAAAFELRRKELVFLTLHHDPFGLAQPERDLLIDAGDGTYYVSIAIR
jgi:hypothetical protein